MRFIDTHSHIYDEAFSQEEDAAVERAVRAGVTKIILPDIDSSSRESMFALALRHPGTLFPCLGLHPTSIAENWQEEMDKVRSHLDKDIRAIGEIGIDCYWSKDFLDQQKEAFIQQLHIAHEKNLPVIIHSRESTGIILDILNSHIPFINCNNHTLAAFMGNPCYFGILFRNTFTGINYQDNNICPLYRTYGTDNHIML